MQDPRVFFRAFPTDTTLRGAGVNGFRTAAHRGCIHYHKSLSLEHTQSHTRYLHLHEMVAPKIAIVPNCLTGSTHHKLFCVCKRDRVTNTWKWRWKECLQGGRIKRLNRQRVKPQQKPHSPPKNKEERDNFQTNERKNAAKGR